MAKYKTYPEYKDSGVEWLRAIPKHWEIHSLKRSVDGCTNGIWGREPDGQHDIIVLRVADFNRQSFKISDLKLTTRSIPPKDRGSRLLKKGDLLIEKSGGGDKTFVGCVVVFDKSYETVTSNFVAKMSPLDRYDSYFLTYAFSQLYAGKVNHPSIKQTTGIQNLDSESYLMEKFCFPPKYEQVNISSFLDHKTAKIDYLIEKQQQLIKLLKEKRQSVIVHAVTKGLNPDEPMKDSRVEWLGEIPDYWIVCKLKHLATIKNGQDYKSVQVEDGYPVMGSGGQFAFASKFLYNKPSVLLGRKGTIDKPLYIDVPFWTIDTMYYTELNKDVDAKYFYFLALSIQFSRYSTNTALPSMTQENLSNYKFAVPKTASERRKITDFLNQETAKIDTLIEKQLQQIELLKERRTALISAAVTGKIDVRDWVAPETPPQSVEDEMAEEALA